MTKSVVVLSGGMDSTTALYTARQESEVVAVGFDYGQRHSKELRIAQEHCSHLGVPYKVFDMPHWAEGGSALTGGSDVPEGHYAEITMKQTVVPNRNSIMLNVAVGYAMSIDAQQVWTGVHAGDHPVYPDCRPEFLYALQRLVDTANEGHNPPLIVAPFITVDKSDIVRLGDDLDVDWAMTWSCYKGGRIHCGRCSTCVERQEAFYLAQVEDPTAYEDTDYWRSVTQ